MRIEPAEYAMMRSWFAYMVPKVFPAGLLNAETDPVGVLDRTAAKFPAKARRGLGMAIGDFVEETSNWSATDVAKCDGELSEKGLPTLTDVQIRFSKLVQRAVRRGSIKNDDEFYAIRNVADLPGSDSAALWELLAAYEDCSGR